MPPRKPKPPPPDLPFLCAFDPTRYKRAYLFGQVPEGHVQRDIIAALALLRIRADWVDSGGAAIRGKVWGAMMRARVAEGLAQAILRNLGGVSAADPGRSDLSGTLAPNGRSWYIEVKAPAWLNPKTEGIIRNAGEPTLEQLDFLIEKHAMGAIVGVAWSVDDALEILGPEAIKAHKAALG